jgi:ribonuclease BN (tRNA processing enzyme)
MVKIQFVGTGDASASGGRYFTCFYVESRDVKFLIDCGVTVRKSPKTE